MHRQMSDCIGFVSLTHKMKIAHRFGSGRYAKGDDEIYHIYIAEMQWGLYKHSDDHEGEHTAIGSVPIVAHRTCSGKNKHCQSVFIHENIESPLKDKIVEALLFPYEIVEHIAPESEPAMKQYEQAPSKHKRIKKTSLNQLPTFFSNSKKTNSSIYPEINRPSAKKKTHR